MKRDIATFTGKTGQYVFVSSASVYEKPVRHYLMTERTPLENKYWQYSRDKIACERLLRDQDKLVYTIVRPSHTVRTHMPIQVGDPDVAVRRMIAGKPVIVAGDGSSVWTLTRSVDVAAPFVRLLGNSAALNDDFHITRIAVSPGTRFTRRSGAGSASRRSMRTCRPRRSSASTRTGWARCSATRLGRLCSTIRR
jgi:nucleoside-diphosphate-sugar epimerase